jgi:glycosyltransferase involved in cell wall biosynthesis
VIRNPVITPDLARAAAEPCPHPWVAEPSPARGPVIVGAGRFQRQKDFPTLIRAFARLRLERPCRLLLLGEGGWRDRLVALIQDLGLGAEVDLPGFQPNLYPFLARADLFVLSSAWEGSPNVLTEAMALGTPVVSTDCPSGPREILEGGRFGPLVPVGDTDALAAAMARTLDSPLPAQTLIEAVAEYRQEISAARYLAVLEEAAGQG